MTPARLPWLTLLIVSLCSLLACIPDSARWLLFDREAILAGQWWRLFSGHFVHFTPAHLLLDVAGFALAGTLLEVHRRVDLLPLLFAQAVSISLALLMFEPALARYGGLSGIACGTLLYSLLTGLADAVRWRTLYALTAGLLCLKIGAELLGLPASLYTPGPAQVVSVPLAHLAGLLSALLFFFVRRRPIPAQTAALTQYAGRTHRT